METQLSLSDLEVVIIRNVIKRIMKNDLIYDYEKKHVEEVFRQLPNRTKEEKPHLSVFL